MEYNTKSLTGLEATKDFGIDFDLIQETKSEIVDSFRLRFLNLYKSAKSHEILNNITENHLRPHLNKSQNG